MAHAILVTELHSIQYLDEIPIRVTYGFWLPFGHVFRETIHISTAATCREKSINNLLLHIRPGVFYV
jgi:hypothetical protein